MNTLKDIDILAKQTLNNTEYATFFDILALIDKRIVLLKSQSENSNNTAEKKELRYPHDLILTLDVKIFRNNQIGERVELVDCERQQIIKKLSLIDDVSEYLKNLVQKILDSIQ